MVYLNFYYVLYDLSFKPKDGMNLYCDDKSTIDSSHILYLSIVFLSFIISLIHAGFLGLRILDWGLFGWGCEGG